MMPALHPWNGVTAREALNSGLNALYRHPSPIAVAVSLLSGDGLYDLNDLRRALPDFDLPEPLHIVLRSVSEQDGVYDCTDLARELRALPNFDGDDWLEFVPCGAPNVRGLVPAVVAELLTDDQDDYEDDNDDD